MKILLNCLSEAWGGRETSFFDDAVELKKLGSEVLVTIIQNSPLEKKFLSLFPEIKLKKIKCPTFKYFNPILLIKYFKIIKEFEPDIVHSHDTWSLYTLLTILRFFPKIPLFATQHLYIQHEKGGIYRTFLFKRLTQMIAISKTLVTNILDNYPLSLNQISYIYGGFSYNYIDRIKNENFSKKSLEIKENDFVIGTLGRIDPQKSQLDLLKAFQMLKNKNYENLHLLIAGSPTINSDESLEYSKKIDDFIKGNHLSSFITKLGHVENVSSFMNLLDLFVMPSKFEAFGLVLIQAMSKRVPLIATNAGSTKEIIDTGKNGFLYPPGDINALSCAIEKFIVSENIEEYKRHCKLKFENTFKNEHHLKNLLELYKSKINELGK